MNTCGPQVHKAEFETKADKAKRQIRAPGEEEMSDKEGIKVKTKQTK
jgi:hypothetical protein